MSSRQLFIFDKPFMQSLSQEEVDATFQDMQKLGLDILPFPDVDVQIPASTYMRTQSDNLESRQMMEDHLSRMKLLFKFTNSHPDDWFFDTQRSEKWASITQFNRKIFQQDGKIGLPYKRECFDSIRKLLIVTLAIGNVIKEVRNFKSVHKINGQFPYRKVTYLKVGQVQQVARGPSVGHHASPRAHLRRGHIRLQPHGPLRAAIKQIWIAPQFIGASPDFIAARTAYKLNIQLQATKFECNVLLAS